ncbi:YdaS family helix-turn-helix protein [Granulibacter bethesdensis]|uniref:YdaS family helix-turn-helix protein n=1 Tax=Granulibacter bethesdensis TaxID=364410 RepID=UPI0009334952|nr:hypothetical protein GbCGDNIH2_10004 [Granulibacter bethesdensis]
MTPADLIAHVGGPTRLSRALGHRSHSSVLKWKEIPLKSVLKIEQAFGIPRETLRPDYFPKRIPRRSKDSL